MSTAERELLIEVAKALRHLICHSGFMVKDLNEAIKAVEST